MRFAFIVSALISFVLLSPHLVYLKYDLLDSECNPTVGISNFIPLFHVQNGIYSVCTVFLNEVYLDKYLLISFNVSDGKKIIVQPYSPKSTEIFDDRTNYCSLNNSKAFESSHFPLEKCVGSFFNQSRKSNFSILYNEPYFYQEELHHEKELVVRRIFTEMEFCDPESEDVYQVDFYRTGKEEIRSLGYSIRCNDSLTITQKKIFNVLSTSSSEYAYLGRSTLRLIYEQCLGPKPFINVFSFQSILPMYYLEYCFQEATVMDLESYIKTSLEQCEFQTTETFNSENCLPSSLITTTFQYSGICEPTVCEIPKIDRFVTPLNYYSIPKLCSWMVYNHPDNSYVNTYYNTPNCDGEKLSFFQYKPSSSCDSQYNFLGKSSYSQKSSCFDSKQKPEGKYIMKRGIPIGFTKPSCNIESNDDMNQFVAELMTTKEIVGRKMGEKIKTIWKNFLSLAVMGNLEGSVTPECIPESFLELGLMWNNNVTKSIMFSCDSNNRVNALEFSGPECKPQIGNRIGKDICYVLSDEFDRLSGAGGVHVICSPFVCFGKTEYQKDVCSGHGKCIDFDKCDCSGNHQKLLYSGAQCNIPLFLILSVCVPFSVISLLCCVYFICSCCFFITLFLCVCLYCSSYVYSSKDKTIVDDNEESLLEKIPLFEQRERQRNNPFINNETETEAEDFQYSQHVIKKPTRFEGDLDGKGKIYNEENKVIFEGNFINGMKEGKGKEFGYIRISLPTSDDISDNDEEYGNNIDIYSDENWELRKKKKKKKKKKEYVMEERRVILFEGNYRENVRHGRGIEYSNQYGKQLEGKYVHGQLVSIETEFVDLPKIKISDYHPIDYVKDRIGSGGEGIVFRVKHLGKDAALKILKDEQNLGNTKGTISINMKNEIQKGLRIRRFIRSQNIWSKVSSHPFILELLAWTGTEEEVMGSVTELCKETLSQLISSGSLQWNDKIRILYETAIAMKFLHSQSIMHRDLKPSNILLDYHNSVKICDFEFSRYDEFDWRSIAQDVSFLGTNFSSAPEVLRGDSKYTKKCDVYSYGILVYCVFYGVSNPYEKMNVCPVCGKKLSFLIQHISNCNLRPLILDHNENISRREVILYSWIIERLIRPCVFVKEAEKRPSFFEIVEIFKEEVKKKENESEEEEEEEEEGEEEEKKESLSFENSSVN